MNLLTQSYLKECLDYSLDTGTFTWKTRPIEHFKTDNSQKLWNARFSNKDIGSLHCDGYFVIRLGGKNYLSHRIAWLYVHGCFPENQIDHVNGIRTDNRLINLRPANNAENAQNERKARLNNKSGFLGVSWNRDNKKFRARIITNGKSKHLGYFESPEEAHENYLQEKRKLHPYNTL